MVRRAGAARRSELISLIGHANVTRVGHDRIVAVALEAKEVVPAHPFLGAKPRPLVVGHRGVPLLHQENTLAGFRRAVELGLGAIELDVRLTRDRRAIVFHDANAERLTGARRAIADLTWDEIARLRIARRPRGAVVAYEREEPISLLSEVLAEVGHAVAINIELKPRWFGDDIASVVAADVAAARAESRVLVTSFDPRKLRDANAADPRLALGYCWNSSLFGAGRRIVERVVAAGVRAVGADHELLTDEVVARLRKAGVAIGGHVVYPIDGRPTLPHELDRLLARGLAWLESDDPERLQRYVG